MNIYLIAAVAKNGCIGKDGKIPWHIPEDLKTFRTLTTGSVVIMGRRTFDSIGKPLPNRINIVISRAVTAIPGVTVVSSIEEALTAVCMLRTQTNCHIFVIGGSDIYRAFMPIADGMYVNHIGVDVLDGDTFFPIINPLEWSRHPFADGLVSTTMPSKWIYYARTKKKE